MGGSLQVGAEVEISPSGRRARVRTIQSHKKNVSEIGPGNRVALNLAGLQREGAERGDAIVEPNVIFGPGVAIGEGVRRPRLQREHTREVVDRLGEVLLDGGAGRLVIEAPDFGQLVVGREHPDHFFS